MGPVVPVIAVAAPLIVDSIRSDNSDEVREAQRQFQNQINKQNQIIQNETQRNNDELNKKKEEQKRLEEEEAKKKRENEEKKKEEELILEKQKIEEENKKNNAINDCNNMKNNFEVDFNLIKETCLNKSNLFCLGKENIFDKKIKNEIQQIYNNSNLKNSIEIFINNIFNEKIIEESSNNEEIKKRILIIGKSGVGKSSLINSIFNYELAETGIGGSITLHEKPKKYEYITQKNLILYDTKGIEINPLNGIQNTIQNVKSFINEQLNNNESIHCIYYCITGNRIEDIELNLIKELNDIYHNSSLNIIFVYTQCISQEDSNLIKNLIKNKIGDKFEYISVLAKEMIIEDDEIPAFGLDELLKLSDDVINKNLDDILITYCKNKVKEYLNNLFNDFNGNNINDILKYYYNKYNSNIDQNFIDNLENYLKNEIEKIINEELNKIVNEENEKLMIKIKNGVTELINKHGIKYINLKTEDLEKEYKDKIKNALYTEYSKIGKENIYKGICLTLKNEIQNLIINRNNEVLNNLK